MDKCPKCKYQSLRFNFGRYICQRCKALFTREMIFVTYDPDCRIMIEYKYDDLRITKYEVKELSERKTQVIHTRLLKEEEHVKKCLKQQQKGN